MKKPIENSCNYLEASIPPNPKSNGFAGEPTITAIVTAMDKMIPTAINRLFISESLNSQLKTDCAGTS